MPTLDHMKDIPVNVSESVRRRNPHLYPGKSLRNQHGEWEPISQGKWETISKPPKRIRQSTKPLMNKLEQRFFDHLCIQHKHLYAQAITFRLANGVRYTPDVFCFEWVWQHETRNVAWEVKGPWFTDDAKVKIKLFAAAYPEILVLLVSEDKDTGLWHNQIVYP